MFNCSGDSFIEKCLRGEVLMEKIDDFVNEWHEGKSDIELHNFLGMTWEEYSLWVADPAILPFIVIAHKANCDLRAILEDLETLPLATRAENPQKAIALMKCLKKMGTLD